MLLHMYISISHFSIHWLMLEALDLEVEREGNWEGIMDVLVIKLGKLLVKLDGE